MSLGMELGIVAERLRTNWVSGSWLLAVGSHEEARRRVRIVRVIVAAGRMVMGYLRRVQRRLRRVGKGRIEKSIVVQTLRATRCGTIAGSQLWCIE